MTPLEASLRRIIDELVAARRSYALVGDLAVSVRADPRLTRDADIVVSVVDDADAENLVGRLRDRYEVLALVEQEVTGRLATVRLVARDEERPVVVDLLFASSGIEHEIVDEAEELEILPGLMVRVASVGHLIAMKLLARDDRRRPADADDLAGLRAIATADDWKVAEQSVVLISERGADRGRDLGSALAVLRDSGAFLQLLVGELVDRSRQITVRVVSEQEYKATLRVARVRFANSRRNPFQQRGSWFLQQRRGAGHQIRPSGPYPARYQSGGTTTPY